MSGVPKIEIIESVKELKLLMKQQKTGLGYAKVQSIYLLKIKVADALLPNVKADAFLADRAYDAQERMIDKLQEKGCEIVIPSTSRRNKPREYDKHLYKARHLIENFLARLKQYRGIATRYDKRATNFLGAIYRQFLLFGSIDERHQVNECDRF